MNGIILAASFLVGALAFLGIFYANKAVEIGKGRPIERGINILFIVVSLVGGIVALGLLDKFPSAAKITSIVFLALILLMQILNVQGAKRMWSWNFFSGIYAIAMALSIAKIFDRSGFQARELIWLILFVLVLIVGAIRVKTYDRVKDENKVDWKTIVIIALLVIIAIVLTAAILLVLSNK